MENNIDPIVIKFRPDGACWNQYEFALISRDLKSSLYPIQPFGSDNKLLPCDCNGNYPTHHRVRKKRAKSKFDNIHAGMPLPPQPTAPPLNPILLRQDLNLSQTQLSHKTSAYHSINIPHPAAQKSQLTCLPSPSRLKTDPGSACNLRPSVKGHSNGTKMHPNPTFLTSYYKNPTKKWPPLLHWHDRLSFPVIAALTYKHRMFEWNWLTSNLIPVFLLILTLLTLRVSATPLSFTTKLAQHPAIYRMDLSGHNANVFAHDTRLQKNVPSKSRSRRISRSIGEEGMAEIENFLKNLLPKLTSKVKSVDGHLMKNTTETVKSQGLKARSITRALLKQAALVIGKAKLDDRVTEEDDYDNSNYDDEDIFMNEDYPQSYDNLKYQFQKGFPLVPSNSLVEKHHNWGGLMTPKKYSKFHSRNSFILQIAPDGNVNGTKDSSSQNSLLQITNIGSHSAIQIYGIATKRYICMDVTGNLYSSTSGKMKKECIFIKSPYGHHYFTLHSIVPHLAGDKNSAFLDKDRFYVGLTYTGHPKSGFKSQRHSRSSHFFATYH